MSAFHHNLAVIDRPCPGPGDILAADQFGSIEPCPESAIIGKRGSHAERCKRCAKIRVQRSQALSQRRLNQRRDRIALKVAMGIKRSGQGKTPKPLLHETPRTPVKRCKVCLGTPHLREPGREDEYGIDVCTPGTTRCRGCAQPYIPLPEIRARAVLGSSSAAAVGASPW